MKRIFASKRVVSLVVTLIILIGLFITVAVRTGPLAPVAVTSTTVEFGQISPALSGIGTVEARYTYPIGPRVTGRLSSLEVDVGDMVAKDQRIGSMDPVDLLDQKNARQAAIHSAEARLRQAETSLEFAAVQAERYAGLYEKRAVSRELSEEKVRERDLAEAALVSSRAELARLQAELEALQAQLRNLDLLGAEGGLVVARLAEPGATVSAGQTVVEIIDPSELWIDARFDQAQAQGLRVGLVAHVILRSQPDLPLAGEVVRVEPRADAVTEELRAKIAFRHVGEIPPPLGELAEVSVILPSLAESVILPLAALQVRDGQRGVWLLPNTDARRAQFVPLKLGRHDLEGRVQVLEGIEPGDVVVLYRSKLITEHTRLRLVTSLEREMR